MNSKDTTKVHDLVKLKHSFFLSFCSTSERVDLASSFFCRRVDNIIVTYHIYSNKRRGAYLGFLATSAALIRGRRLFKNSTRQIYFFYIFIQRYTFYLLIFLWTDSKLIVNLELREKFTRWKESLPPEQRNALTLN